MALLFISPREELFHCPFCKDVGGNANVINKMPCSEGGESEAMSHSLRVSLGERNMSCDYE